MKYKMKNKKWKTNFDSLSATIRMICVDQHAITKNRTLIYTDDTDKH